MVSARVCSTDRSLGPGSSDVLRPCIQAIVDYHAHRVKVCTEAGQSTDWGVVIQRCGVIPGQIIQLFELVFLALFIPLGS